MNKESKNPNERIPDDLFKDSIYRSRLASVLLFAFYSLLVTYWFSSVVDLITPSVIVLCLLLAWGSLKVNANWVVLGEIVVLVAKFGWQSPRIEILSALWLSYVGILMFAFRAKYRSLHERLTPSIPPTRSPGVTGVKRRAMGFASYVSINVFGCLVTVVTGFLLLMYSPFGGSREAWIDWSLQNGDTMLPGISVVLILFGSVVFLREWNWRWISARQASMYLRTDRVGWQYRDLSRVVRVMMNDDKEKSRVD